MAAQNKHQQQNSATPPLSLPPFWLKQLSPYWTLILVGISIVLTPYVHMITDPSSSVFYELQQ
jgi:hypothetical protein